MGCCEWGMEIKILAAEFLIMIPQLRQFHAALGDAIDDAVLLVNPPRPPARQRVPQRFECKGKVITQRQWLCHQHLAYLRQYHHHSQERLQYQR